MSIYIVIGCVDTCHSNVTLINGTYKMHIYSSGFIGNGTFCEGDLFGHYT